MGYLEDRVRFRRDISFIVHTGLQNRKVAYYYRCSFKLLTEVRRMLHGVKCFVMY